MHSLDSCFIELWEIIFAQIDLNKLFTVQLDCCDRCWCLLKFARYIFSSTLTVFVFEWHVCVDNVALLFKNYIFQIFPQGSSQPPSQQLTLQPTGEDSEHSHHFTIQVRPFVFHVDFYIVILTIWFTLTITLKKVTIWFNHPEYVLLVDCSSLGS